MPVLTPTSVPNPYRNPSANRVLALTNTPALSIPLQNALLLASDSVTMLSVWCEPCALMCSIAAAREGTALTARTSSRNSVSKSSSLAAEMSGEESREERAERVAGSHRSWMFLLRSVDASVGQRVARSESWMRSVSAELQAAV